MIDRQEFFRWFGLAESPCQAGDCLLGLDLEPVAASTIWDEVFAVSIGDEFRTLTLIPPTGIMLRIIGMVTAHDFSEVQIGTVTHAGAPITIDSFVMDAGVMKGGPGPDMLKLDWPVFCDEVIEIPYRRHQHDRIGITEFLFAVRVQSVRIQAQSDDVCDVGCRMND